MDLLRIEWDHAGKRWAYEPRDAFPRFLPPGLASEHGLTDRSPKARVLEAIRAFEGVDVARLVRWGCVVAVACAAL